MRKISAAVADIVNEDQTAREALRSGILNLSAYASRIRRDVERQTWKDVKTGSITVALSRLAKTAGTAEPLIPDVALQDITITDPLCDITYPRTEAAGGITAAVRTLTHAKPMEFLAMTAGVREITVIAGQPLKADILRMVPERPVSVVDGLTGITMHFPVRYLSVPNVIYALVGTFAARRINILEIVSTYTELTVVVENSRAREAVERLMQLKSPRGKR
jgi:hypothetical protein